MNLQKVCTSLQISLGDVLYLCHIPSREKDADGCFLHWAGGLMVITSLVFFFPFPACLPFSVLTFFSCQTPLEEGSHLLQITSCSESNVTMHTCGHVNTGKWRRKTNHNCRETQRYPKELNVFEKAHIYIKKRKIKMIKKHQSKTNCKEMS